MANIEIEDIVSMDLSQYNLSDVGFREVLEGGPTSKPKSRSSAAQWRYRVLFNNESTLSPKERVIVREHFMKGRRAATLVREMKLPLKDLSTLANCLKVNLGVRNDFDVVTALAYRGDVQFFSERVK